MQDTFYLDRANIDTFKLDSHISAAPGQNGTHKG
jgi:hypothetical protein